MRIKKLFKTESEYLDYAWSFINFDQNNIWREEDLPKLEPFFAFSSKHHDSYEMTPAERESFEYYKKCCFEYADDLFEIRDSIQSVQHDQLFEFFMLEPRYEPWDYDDKGNEIDEEGNIVKPLSRGSLKIHEDMKDEISFPMVFVGWLENSFDRTAGQVIFSEIVTLKDFN